MHTKVTQTQNVQISPPSDVSKIYYNVMPFQDRDGFEINFFLALPEYSSYHLIKSKFSGPSSIDTRLIRVCSNKKLKKLKKRA